MKKPIKKNARAVWNAEYDEPQYFTMSMQQSAELGRFVRWLKKDSGNDIFEYIRALDVGCGNGRNLLYLAENYGTTGMGCDLSDVAVAQATRAAKEHNIKDVSFFVHDLAEKFALEDASFDLVMDMMVSHCLDKAGREQFIKEVVRMLKPGGWYLVKTFMKEGDQHAKRLIEKSPGTEPDSYIHPRLGVMEHVWTEQSLHEFLEPYFNIKFTVRSSGYQRWNNQPYKRRYMVVYAEKK